MRRTDTNADLLKSKFHVNLSLSFRDKTHGREYKQDFSFISFVYTLYVKHT
jgi:hypothetical protein